MLSYRPGVFSAVVMGTRAARMAGGMPPRALMRSANPMVTAADGNVKVRRNASSEKVLKFMVERVTNCRTALPKMVSSPAASLNRSSYY